jgi:hypothetical protein
MSEQIDSVEIEDQIQDEYDDNTLDERVVGVSAWGMSIVIHAIVLLLLLFVYFKQIMEQDIAPIKLVVIDYVPVEEKKKTPDLLDRPVVPTEVLQPTEETDVPVVDQIELPVIENFEREDEVVVDAQAKGREDAVAQSETGSNSFMMSIGAGGGGSGAFGSRTSGGRKAAVSRYKGNRGTENAVEAALRWFAKHQSPNGMWSVGTYQINCQDDGPKCEPGKRANAEADTACSAYAILAYLGAGYDHITPNKFRTTVSNGVSWLLTQQKADGSFDDRNYAHSIALMAIAEAYAMTNDIRLKEPTQKGVDVLLSRQIKGSDYGLGWDYRGPTTRCDSSVSGWCVMSIKSASLGGGINIGNGLIGAKNWVEGAWKAANPNWKELDQYGESGFPYVWNSNSNTAEARPGRESMGSLSAVFLGYTQDNIMLSTMLNRTFNDWMPKAYPLNTYYMYYNTMAQFQAHAGTPKWEQWNANLLPVLLNSQRKDFACFDGSWDSEGTVFHGHETGRLLSTAYCTLTLEVYYRYLPMAMKK